MTTERSQVEIERRDVRRAREGRIGWRRRPAREETVARESESIREPLGAAQGVSLGLGVFLVVIGAVGLARGGLETMTTPVVEVAGLGMTPALALGYLVAGILAFIGMAGRDLGRAILLFLGAVFLAKGIIALIQPVPALGWTEANGVAGVVVAAVAIAVAVAAPSVLEERRRVVEH